MAFIPWYIPFWLESPEEWESEEDEWEEDEE